MRRLHTVFVVSLLACAATAPAAGAQDSGPVFEHAQYWLHANGSQLGNADGRDGKFLRWDATKPTAATPAHYIGFNYATLFGKAYDPQYFLTMEDKIKGDFDNLAFTLYFVGPNQKTINCPVSLAVQLIVDGKTLLSQDYTGSNHFPVSTVDDQTFRTDFTLMNIYSQLVKRKVPLGPDVQHDVRLGFQNFYACNEFVWRYDSAAYPSGFEVNRPDIETDWQFDIADPPAPVS